MTNERTPPPAIEILERAISKLETLRDEAAPEWHQGRDGVRYENAVELYSRREPGEPDSRDVARFDDAADASLAVALSRTVEPMLDMLRHAHEWLLEGNNAAVVEGSSVVRAQITPELEIARAILGEENDHA